MCYLQKNHDTSLMSGDLMDEENVLDFLTSLEAMDRPDRIEEVNAKILGKIVEDTEFVAVLFCKSFSSLYSLYSFNVESHIGRPNIMTEPTLSQSMAVNH